MPVEGEAPACDVLATVRTVSVFGDEPDNPREDRDASAQALCEGQGGAGLPLLSALRQDLSPDILAHAYDLAQANDGAPGVDGETFEMIAAAGEEKWLAALAEELREKTYRPQPVRRVMIPKHGGGERPLGIPTIRDRVVQTAAKLVLEPIFEADLDPEAYGYRPKRSAHDAIKKVHKLLCEGYTDVVDADLSKYFDTIPHCHLIHSVARRIVDRDVLRLIKAWLKAPVEERDEKGNRRLTGGRKNTCGTPQGGVVSPVLANLYMNRFLKYWRMSGQKERLQAQVVNYAD